jgi:hypothetical protein
MFCVFFLQDSSFLFRQKYYMRKLVDAGALLKAGRQVPETVNPMGVSP